MPAELSNLELMGGYLRMLRDPENLDPDIRERYQRLRERGEREQDPNDKEPGARMVRFLHGDETCPCTPGNVCLEHELLTILRDIHARTAPTH